jgi:hypothetical protein
MKFAINIIGFLVVLMSHTVFSDSVCDIVDPRVRTYISPKRVLWKSDIADNRLTSVQNESALLKFRHGQIPEGGWDVKSDGCVLENKGEKPGILLDFGRELHGGLQIGVGRDASPKRIRVRFGESVSEAMSDIGKKGATNDHAIRDDVITVPSFGIREIGNTGFRFVRIDLESAGKISLEFVRAVELMRPMKRIGSFKCSDDRLNRIWDTAVRTVHLCCQDYLWDGIKRDRLVWLGDSHPEARAIMSVFGDANVLKETLDYAIATTPPDKWMNGSFDTYTAWFLRIMRELWFFTGDDEFIKQRGQYLVRTIRHVLDTGCIAKKSQMRGFLDWPTRYNKAAEKAGACALRAMAFDASAELAEVLCDEKLAFECREAAAKLRSQHHHPAGAKSAAALLALSGMCDAHSIYADVLGRNGHAGVSTFYGYYVLEAMAKAGQRQHALNTVRDYWGAMLDMGATSFWEDFNIAWTNNAFRIDEMPVAGKKDIHGDFGDFCYKGFRHSLCHGWSCGPAPWCINNILGIRPVSAGCKKIEIRPFLGDLTWAEGAMALPNGSAVRVRIERKSDGGIDVKVDAPDGIEVICK